MSVSAKYYFLLDIELRTTCINSVPTCFLSSNNFFFSKLFLFRKILSEILESVLDKSRVT